MQNKPSGAVHPLSTDDGLCVEAVIAQWADLSDDAFNDAVEKRLFFGEPARVRAWISTRWMKMRGYDTKGMTALPENVRRKFDCPEARRPA